MSTEAFPDPDFSFLNKGPEKPYIGEVRQPVTELGEYVLLTIAVYGDDNKPPFDKYSHEQRTIKPSAVYVGVDRKAEFGVNYYTHTFDLGRHEIICVYSKADAQAVVYINEFKEGGGVAAQYAFSSKESEPDVIWKSRKTKFASDQNHSPRFGNYQDFGRKLYGDEKQLLQNVLSSPSENLEELSTLLSLTRIERLMTAQKMASDAKLEEDWQKVAEANRSIGGIIQPRRNLF